MPAPDDKTDKSSTNDKVYSTEENNQAQTASQQSRESGSSAMEEDGEGQMFVPEAETNESYENPFLKPAKRVKLTVLMRPS